VKDICKEVIPKLEPITEKPNAFVACHLHKELNLNCYS